MLYECSAHQFDRLTHHKHHWIEEGTYDDFKKCVLTSDLPFLMNRKQKRRLWRHGNRERYLLNRRHWCPVGPPVVMDDPTEAHVKSLLMEWIGPRVILDEVAKEMTSHQAKSMEAHLYSFMATLGEGAVPTLDLWRHLVHGTVVNNFTNHLRVADA